MRRPQRRSEEAHLPVALVPAEQGIRSYACVPPRRRRPLYPAFVIAPHTVSRHPHTKPLSTNTAQAAHAAPDERTAQLCAPAAASMGAPGAQRLGRHHCLWLLARLLARLDSELPFIPLQHRQGPGPLYPTHCSGRLGVQGRAAGEFNFSCQAPPTASGRVRHLRQLAEQHVAATGDCLVGPAGWHDGDAGSARAAVGAAAVHCWRLPWTAAVQAGTHVPCVIFYRLLSQWCASSCSTCWLFLQVCLQWFTDAGVWLGGQCGELAEQAVGVAKAAARCGPGCRRQRAWLSTAERRHGK